MVVDSFVYCLTRSPIRLFSWSSTCHAMPTCQVSEVQVAINIVHLLACCICLIICFHFHIRVTHLTHTWSTCTVFDSFITHPKAITFVLSLHYTVRLRYGCSACMLLMPRCPSACHAVAIPHGFLLSIVQTAYTRRRVWVWYMIARYTQFGL